MFFGHKIISFKFTHHMMLIIHQQHACLTVSFVFDGNFSGLKEVRRWVPLALQGSSYSNDRLRLWQTCVFNLNTLMWFQSVEAKKAYAVNVHLGTTHFRPLISPNHVMKSLVGVAKCLQQAECQVHENLDANCLKRNSVYRSTWRRPF